MANADFAKSSQREVLMRAEAALDAGHC